MAYLLRLIAAALLTVGCSPAIAQTCPGFGAHGLFWSSDPSSPVFLLGVGQQFYCGSVIHPGCEYQKVGFSAVPPVGYNYDTTGKVCAPNPDINGSETHYFYGGFPDGGENPGNGGGGENPPNGETPCPEGSSCGTVEPPPDENEGGDGGDPGSGSGGGNGETPGDDAKPGIPDKPGIPENSVFCGDEVDYKHKCYDEDGDYWYKDSYYDVCDPAKESIEPGKGWRDCFYDGRYYNSDPLTSRSRSFSDPKEYKYRDCIHSNSGIYYYLGSSLNEVTYKALVSTQNLSAKNYCENRYGDYEEDRLYDDAVVDFRNNQSVTEGLPGNEEIDISKRLGVVVNDDGSMSSSLEDFLEYAKPNKSGTHGVCLDDIEIEIGNEIIVLEISRVCEWLEYLGTILLFISYFIAFQIIARD